jgi:hypothetical protein
MASSRAGRCRQPSGNGRDGEARVSRRWRAAAADLADDLAPDRLGEVGQAADLHHEGAGAGDDVALVVVAQVGLVAQDGEAVDGHAGLGGAGARHGDGIAAVPGRVAGLAAVAGDVDDGTPGADPGGGEQVERGVERGAEMGHAAGDPGPALEQGGEAGGVEAVADRVPAEDVARLVLLAPEDRRDEHGSGGVERGEHLGVAEGGGEAFDLQEVLGVVDAARGVDGEHEGDVRAGRGLGGRGAEGERGGEERRGREGRAACEECGQGRASASRGRPISRRSLRRMAAGKSATVSTGMTKESGPVMTSCAKYRSRSG